MFRDLALLGSIALSTLALRPAAAQENETPRIVLEALDGAVSSKPLAGVAAARLADLPAACVRFEQLGGEPEVLAPADAVEARLVGGDWLQGKVAGGSGDVLELELAGKQKVALIVDLVESLVFNGRLNAGQRGMLQRPEHGDRLLWIRPGGVDRVDGTLEAFGAEGPKFKSVLGSRTFPWGEVAALFVETAGEPEPRTARPDGVIVELARGGRVHARMKRLDEHALALEEFAGRSIELPLAAVAEVCTDDGSLAFLSDLAPLRAVEGWPSDDDLGMKWSYQVDRSVTGTPLRAGGRDWRRGLGVHAPSRLEWKLDGTWTKLRGSVAIDDSVLLLTSRGSVQFRVYLDGAAQPAWNSGRAQGGEPVIAMPPIALEGVHALTLEVDMDDKLYVADRADWLRVRLTREKP